MMGAQMVTLRHARGFTLIELMIAGLLGLILTAGLIQIFVGTAQTTKVQAAVSDVQDKGRLAMEFLTREIENAGFVDDTLLPGGFSTLPVNVDFAVTADGDTDTLQIQYVGTVDCTGAVINGVITNTFDVVNGELRCNGQPLVDGVDGFQALYGVDSDNDGFVDQYMTATRVVATGSQTRVHSVRISLLISTLNNVFPRTTAQTFQLLDAPAVSFNDRRLRRQFTTTVVLQNRP
ncbi:MAG: hypothetical protein D6694_07600 [Gammaproteobacteria bacterium]|nr:MAG: hypothetical protein D6694_07600 [Gammaproteobacteria bacterium]